MNLMPVYKKYLYWRDAHFPMGKLLRHTQYVLAFKTTNYCWYKCPHCCENAGPDNPKTFIPADVICRYLDQAKADPMFDNNVVFTGGEIMSAYHFGPADYVPTLLNKSLDLGIGTNIKTNAAWAHAEFREKIFSDLHNVAAMHRPYSMQISLSLDRYHKNALENNARVIARLAKMPDTGLSVHISSFENHVDMLPELLDRIKAEKLSAEEVFVGDMDNMKSAIMVGGQILLIHSKGRLFDGGRARGMDGAFHTEYPQFSFLCGDMTSMLAFDSRGRVTRVKIQGARFQPNGRACMVPGR